MLELNPKFGTQKAQPARRFLACLSKLLLWHPLVTDTQISKLRNEGKLLFESQRPQVTDFVLRGHRKEWPRPDSPQAWGQEFPAILIFKAIAFLSVKCQSLTLTAETAWARAV